MCNMAKKISPPFGVLPLKRENYNILTKIIMISYFALYWVVLMLGILFLMFQKKKKLSGSDKAKFISYLGRIENSLSPQQQVVECDKLYHQILKAYGYRGTFWEILKKKPSIILNLQAVWELHKLRNTLVHDLNDLPDALLRRESKNYQREILKLLNK